MTRCLFMHFQNNWNFLMKLIPYLPSGSLKWPRPQWVPLIESVSLAFDLDIPLDIQISKPTIISIWSEFILFYNWLSCINLSINYKWYPENLLIDIICTYIYIYIHTYACNNQPRWTGYLHLRLPTNDANWPPGSRPKKPPELQKTTFRKQNVSQSFRE